MNGIVKLARFAHPIAAASVVALVFAQVYLIAAFVFGDPDALDAHMTVGRVVVGFELLTFATALVGWWRDWPEVWLGSALVVVGGLQVSLAKDLGTSPRVHAFHGVLALVVVVLASVITVRTWRELAPRFTPAEN